MAILPISKPVFPCTEILQWNTQILYSADGSEQRVGLRKVPRQIFTYEYPLASDAEVARMDAILHYNAKRLWYIPIWPEQTIHTANLAAGATTITMDTTNADYRGSTKIGNYAVIWKSASQYEVVTVSTVAAGTLTVSALANIYAGSKVIAPCRTGYMVGASRKQRWQTGVAMLELTFEIIDNLPVEDWESTHSIDNIEILVTPSYVPGRVYDHQVDPDIIVIDTATGRRTIGTVSDFNINMQTHQWANWSKADSWSFRQWLHWITGRQKCFLVPTFRNDITLAAQCAAADTTITVVNRGFTDYMGYNLLRTYLAFRPAGSDPVVRRVTSMTELSATQEQLGISAKPDAIYAAGSNLCWVDICRLASDTVELTWHKPGCHTCEAMLTRVKNPATIFGEGLFGIGVMAG